MKYLLLLSHFKSNRGTRRGGFTLVEILVAVAIMSLLLAIIIVPLRLGFETYHIGTARTGLQQEMQLTMQQINKDFRRADFVFPNTRISGISDNTNTASTCALQPYPNATNWNYLPYFRTETAPTSVTDLDAFNSGIGITNSSNTLKAIPNLSRIDMLFLRNGKNGTAAKTGEDYVVTYYPRRLNMNAFYDAIDNPIVLFRAQYPYRRLQSNGFQPQPAFDNTNAFNALTDWTTKPSLGGTSNDPTINRSYKWLTHNYFGETNLEPLCKDVDAVAGSLTSPAILQDVVASHTLVTPRGMQLIAPSAGSGGKDTFIPEISFVESSSDGNRIDRVTVNMTLGQYDQAGAAAANGQGKAQRVPVTQTFDLPNAGCSN